MNQRNSHGRDRNLGFRLLEEEAKILDEKAKEAGMSKSEFIRSIVLHGGAYPKTAFNDEDKHKLGYEINRIGNSLSQIEIMAHNSHEIDAEEFRLLMANYTKLLSAFSRHISCNESVENCNLPTACED